MREIILDHLQKHGVITTWEAIQKYHCTRLSEYIRQLRADGYVIESESVKFVNRQGKKSHYVKYRLRT